MVSTSLYTGMMTQSMSQTIPQTSRLAQLDHVHVWHPFTAMGQWRDQRPLIIESGQGDYLIDTEGKCYIDGVSSLWCNVHGHQVQQIDDAIRQQLDRIAHSTLLGLAGPPSIELAAMLVERAPGKLNKVFYSDAGATAVEVALKMAVGYWHNRGCGLKHRFIGLAGGYHGDTIGAMSVGYNETFHQAYLPMLFEASWFPAPDACRLPAAVVDTLKEQGFAIDADCFGMGECGLATWPSECTAPMTYIADYCLDQLEQLLKDQGEETAAIVIEPVMQGAGGMISQPPGFVRSVAELARRYNVLLIADEVAVGFGRTGKMFAVEHDGVEPDILCLGKGLTGGYLPLAATLATDEVEQSFAGDIEQGRTLYHGHTYTGNALACAAAIASLKLFESSNLLEHIKASTRIIRSKLEALRDPEPCPHVLDIRQQGMMVGIELCPDRQTSRSFDPANPPGQVGPELCQIMRQRGLIIRPLGDVLVLMPILAMEHATLENMLNIVVETILEWPVGV
jgi:adenosylmethionine-8-amino-7-oxononanoate aminotransferase